MERDCKQSAMTTSHAHSASFDPLESTCFDSYWIDSLPPDSELPSLRSDIECNLLIVGGGFCGFWAAILAKEQQPDRNVVLIEAKRIGNGASARPAAILSTSVMHGIDNTQRLFPDEVAQLEQLGKENIDAIKATLERYSIDCELELSGEMKVSIGRQGLDAVNTDYEMYTKYGHDAQLLDKQQVQSEIHSPLFHGAIWSRSRSGTLHPGKLVRALKNVAVQLGISVFENTPHIRNSMDKGRVRVATPNAHILASKVLLATNAWAAGHRKISQRVVGIRDRIVVTQPLSDEQLASVGWTNRQGIYDTRTQLNYMRLTADNRILFGGRLGYFYNNDTDPFQDKRADPYRALAEAFFKTFPQLYGQICFSHAWSGPIGLTSRMAVHYQRFYNGRMVFAGGYSGFGVGATRFGARVGLAILDGDATPETRMQFANTIPGYVPPEPFRWIGAKITMYALDTYDEKGGWRKPWIALVQRMGFPIVL